MHSNAWNIKTTLIHFQLTLRKKKSSRKKIKFCIFCSFWLKSNFGFDYSLEHIIFILFSLLFFHLWIHLYFYVFYVAVAVAVVIPLFRCKYERYILLVLSLELRERNTRNKCNCLMPFSINNIWVCYEFLYYSIV